MTKASRVDEEAHKRQQLNEGRLFGKAITTPKDKKSMAMEDESDEESRSSSEPLHPISQTKDGRLRIQLPAQKKNTQNDSTSEDERTDNEHSRQLTKRRKHRMDSSRAAHAEPAASLPEESVSDILEVEEMPDTEDFTENEYRPGKIDNQLIDAHLNWLDIVCWPSSLL